MRVLIRNCLNDLSFVGSAVRTDPSTARGDRSAQRTLRRTTLRGHSVSLAIVLGRGIVQGRGGRLLGGAAGVEVVLEQDLRGEAVPLAGPLAGAEAGLAEDLVG